VNLFSVAIAVVCLVGTGGIAYACSSGGGGGCGGSGHGGASCPPSLEIMWKNPSGVHPGAPFVACHLGLTSTELTISVGNLLPGTSCTFSAVLANVGQEAVTLSESVTISEPKKCLKFLYSDNVPHSPARTLPSGGTFSVQGSVGLSASAGNACQGAGASFLVVITGSEESQCKDDPYAEASFPGSVALWDCN